MKQSRPPFLVITFLAILGMLSAALPAGIVRGQSTTLTFKPTADAYVIQSSPDVNFGSNVSIRVDYVPVTRSYLRFAVSGLNGAAVQSAKLRIYANSSNSTGYSVRALGDNGWAEDKITYNNSPAQGDIISKSGQFGGGSWTETDVTSYIKGDGTYNLVLTTSSETSTNLAAREDGAHAPQLVVVAAGSQPPAPTAVAPTATQPPAASPTTAPTNPPAPTAGPTQAPTAAPTGAPTAVPTAAPTATQPPASGDWQPAFPIRAAFYYPWFAEAWTQQGIYPYTNYTPVLGYYSNTDANIIKKHIDMMQYGNIQAGISSWWGQGQHTDTKFPGILAATAGSRFRWSLYYENESMGDPSVTQIRNDLTYIRDHYGKDPSFLRVNGKFVVFVYSAPNDVCGMADRWKQANTVGAYIVLKVFPGYASCASQPDSWHQYSPAVAADSQGSYSYAISPGFWLKGNAVRLARDLNRWIGNVKAMAASGANWQLITTFSEWGEGTIVEPAKEWTSASGYGQYLDALHNNGGGSAPVPVPTATSRPLSQLRPPRPSANGDLPRSSADRDLAGSAADGYPAAQRRQRPDHLLPGRPGLGQLHGPDPEGGGADQEPDGPAPGHARCWWPPPGITSRKTPRPWRTTSSTSERRMGPFSTRAFSARSAEITMSRIPGMAPPMPSTLARKPISTTRMTSAAGTSSASTSSTARSTPAA